MNEPKITVIIPTRERCDVLEKSLKTVTAQDYNNLEIIVSDNYSCDGTEDIVRSANDTRLKYLNTGKRVSMSHNWEFALSHVTEGWVTIIGDDDGLLPCSLNKVAKIIQSTDVKAIRSSVCWYVWPSLTGKEFGSLSIPMRSGYKVRDSTLWLSKVLSGRASYTELPMLYNGGYVSMSILEQIKAKTGSFYRSCNPDVYSAVSISSSIDRYLYMNDPLAINGASRHSTGTSVFSNRTNRDLSPAYKFALEGNIPFHEDLPLRSDGGYPLSLQATVYESYLQSKFLRGEALGNIHSQQLEVILATAGTHDAAVKEWGKVFATIHGLNYEEIQSKASRERFLLKLHSAARRLSRVVNTVSVGSPGFPIKDVYEASIAASAIRHAMPSRLKIIRRIVERAVEKMWRNGIGVSGTGLQGTE